MRVNKSYWRYLFFGDLLVELTAIAFNWHTARFFTKPLLLLLLFTWFMSASVKFSPLRYIIAAALFFSWLGDIFLLHNNAGWFMAGLGSFLLAHLLYIFFFVRARRSQPVKGPWRPVVIAAVVAYTVMLFSVLYKHTGNLQVPVGIYACAIAGMLVTAVHAFNKNYSNAGAWCIPGAALFVISDSLLAIHKFYYAFAGGPFAVMLTYALAQYAITKGCLLYLAAEKKGLTAIAKRRG
ncbi:MAG: lysoplasmalogenase [Chitinophagaceae bacterium]